MAQEVLNFMMTYGLCPKDIVILTDPDIQNAFDLLDDDAKQMIQDMADAMRTGNTGSKSTDTSKSGTKKLPKKKKNKKSGH